MSDVKPMKGCTCDPMLDSRYRCTKKIARCQAAANIIVAEWREKEARRAAKTSKVPT